MIDIFTDNFKKEYDIEQEYYIGNGTCTGAFLSICVIIQFKNGDQITFNKGELVLDRYTYNRLLKNKIKDHKLKIRNDKINHIKNNI